MTFLAYKFPPLKITSQRAHINFILDSNISWLFLLLQSKSMDTQLVYPFRLRQRNSERRRRRIKSCRGVAARKHTGIGELSWFVGIPASDNVKAKREKSVGSEEVVLIYAGKRTHCWHFFTTNVNASRHVCSSTALENYRRVVEKNQRQCGIMSLTWWESSLWLFMKSLPSRSTSKVPLRWLLINDRQAELQNICSINQSEIELWDLLINYMFPARVIDIFFPSRRTTLMEPNEPIT